MFKRIFLFLLVFSSAALAVEPANKTQALRVGGSYKITDIDNNGAGNYRVVFEAEAKTGKFDTLVLNTDHVNFAVKPGLTVRLSAEIIEGDGAKEVAIHQVLLYLPHKQGYVPIWMLSKKGMGRDLNAARYIEMHAPTTDYLLF